MPGGGGGKEEAKNDAHRGRKRCQWATKTYQHDPSVPVILVIAAGRQGKAQEAEAKAEQQQEGGLGHRCAGFGERPCRPPREQASSRVLARCRSCLCVGRKAWGRWHRTKSACANVLIVVKQDGLLVRVGRQIELKATTTTKQRKKARHTHTRFRDAINSSFPPFL